MWLYEPGCRLSREFERRCGEGIGDFIRFIWLYLWICFSERGLNWHGYASDNEKLGYPKKVAGAVEAVASTGGQIMPPLMGAGAFIMVELTGIPYAK